MNKIQSVIIGLLLINTSCEQPSQSTFDKYFTHESLRIDYFHNGDARNESVEIDQLYRYPTWAGSLNNLIDKLDYGSYYYKIINKESGDLIYSKGFDSYFKEYQFSTPAIEGQSKQFHESAIIPLPKAPIDFVLEKRNSSGNLEEIFRAVVDPNKAKGKPIDSEVQVYTSLDNGNPNIKADIAIIGEGYTNAEAGKFEKDLHRFTDVFFKSEPCKSNKDKFNIRGVLKPSIDSGIDEPRAGIDLNTAVGASFNTMGSERYVLTEENKALRDIAGHVPYDALYIMVNHGRYGGGGIYNFYCVYSSDNQFSEYIMVHEFGHSFFGLADEYYTSSTAYNDLHSIEKEPNEPNITAMKDPNDIKWNHLLTADIELPTPWNKERYDSIDIQWQTVRAKMNDSIAALKKNGSSKTEIEKAKALYALRDLQQHNKVQQLLEGSQFAGQVGVFEGAGYLSNGLYRSSLNCIMFTKTDYFCTVCQEAMGKVIKTYSD